MRQALSSSPFQEGVAACRSNPYIASGNELSKRIVRRLSYQVQNNSRFSYVKKILVKDKTTAFLYT